MEDEEDAVVISVGVGSVGVGSVGVGGSTFPLLLCRGHNNTSNFS